MNAGPDILESLRLRCDCEQTRRSKLGFIAFFPATPVPLVQQRPVDRAGAEVGHVQVAFESGDRLVQELIVLAKERAVTGQAATSRRFRESACSDFTNEGMSLP